jgi:hypothetical protein
MLYRRQIPSGAFLTVPLGRYVYRDMARSSIVPCVEVVLLIAYNEEKTKKN